MSNSNVETVGSAGGKLLVALALLIAAAGVVAFYLLADREPVIRVAALLAGLVVGAAVALVSGPGRSLREFGHDAWREVRKVVWPSRKEAGQTTGIVFVFVLTMAVLLWSADKLVEWIVFSLILGWK